MRSLLRYFGATAVLFAVAACSDSATAPSAPAAKSFSPGAPAFDYGQIGRSFGVQSADFKLTARGGTFSINGLYSLTFPENSVCDPARSSYGPGEWDRPCVTLSNNQSVQVHAVLSLNGGGLGIDFTPALRFSPSTQVTISTDVFAPVIRSGRDYFARHPESLDFLAIYYTPTLSAAPVPDFVTDPSVITHVDLSSGRIWRRVKHFSGYNQTAGTACDPGPNNPDCVKIDDK
jgi:hypothetical protein